MAKFSNVKPKNTVYHLFCGKGVVTTITLSNGKVVFFTVKFKNCEATFDVDGYLLDKNCEREEKIVTLYWNEVKLPTEEEDKKPFDLVEFLRENLEPKEFLLEEHNNTINYSHKDGRFFYNYTIYLDRITEIYFKNSKDEIVEVVQVLNENNITPQQLKQAYKILNWL